MDLRSSIWLVRGRKEDRWRGRRKKRNVQAASTSSSFRVRRAVMDLLASGRPVVNGSFDQEREI
jgi:hypothetical protein